MPNYFNSLSLRDQLAQLGKCEFMEHSEFADEANYLRGKKLVVVGGGWLGITVAKKFDLMDDFHCTLVDPKEYFEDNT